MPELTDVKAELQFSAEAKLSKMDWEDLKRGGRVVLTLHVNQDVCETPQGDSWKTGFPKMLHHPIAISLGIAITKPDE